MGGVEGVAVPVEVAIDGESASNTIPASEDPDPDPSPSSSGGGPDRNVMWKRMGILRPLDKKIWIELLFLQE